MTVETEMEIEIGPWTYDKSMGLYSNVNGIYIQARTNLTQRGYIVKLEFKWADDSRNTYATFTLRDRCEKDSELDNVAIKLYKKLQAMLLALEPFKELE